MDQPLEENIIDSSHFMHILRNEGNYIMFKRLNLKQTDLGEFFFNFSQYSNQLYGNYLEGKKDHFLDLFLSIFYSSGLFDEYFDNYNNGNNEEKNKKLILKIRLSIENALKYSKVKTNNIPTLTIPTLYKNLVAALDISNTEDDPKMDIVKNSIVLCSELTHIQFQKITDDILKKYYNAKRVDYESQKQLEIEVRDRSKVIMNFPFNGYLNSDPKMPFEITYTIQLKEEPSYWIWSYKIQLPEILSPKNKVPSTSYMEEKKSSQIDKQYLESALKSKLLSKKDLISFQNKARDKPPDINDFFQLSTVNFNTFETKDIDIKNIYPTSSLFKLIQFAIYKYAMVTMNNNNLNIQQSVARVLDTISKIIQFSHVSINGSEIGRNNLYTYLENMTEFVDVPTDKLSLYVDFLVLLCSEPFILLLNYLTSNIVNKLNTDFVYRGNEDFLPNPNIYIQKDDNGDIIILWKYESNGSIRSLKDKQNVFGTCNIVYAMNIEKNSYMIEELQLIKNDRGSSTINTSSISSNGVPLKDVEGNNAPQVMLQSNIVKSLLSKAMWDTFQSKSMKLSVDKTFYISNINWNSFATENIDKKTINAKLYLTQMIVFSYYAQLYKYFKIYFEKEFGNNAFANKLLKTIIDKTQLHLLSVNGKTGSDTASGLYNYLNNMPELRGVNKEKLINYFAIIILLSSDIFLMSLRTYSDELSHKANLNNQRSTASGPIIRLTIKSPVTISLADKRPKTPYIDWEYNDNGSLLNISNQDVGTFQMKYYFNVIQGYPFDKLIVSKTTRKQLTASVPQPKSSKLRLEAKYAVPAAATTAGLLSFPFLLAVLGGTRRRVKKRQSVKRKRSHRKKFKGTKKTFKKNISSK